MIEYIYGRPVGANRAARGYGMNLILLFEDDFAGPECVQLRGRRFHHISASLGAAVGDVFKIGMINDRVGLGTITSLAGDCLEMEIRLSDPPPPALPVTLILALPRPKVLRRVLTSISAMGVKRMFLLNAYRVEKSFWQSPVLAADMINEMLVRGLEQASDTVLPEIMLRPRFKPFVEDELPEIIKHSQALVAHPAASEPCPRNVDSSVTLTVGPEGGFISYEIEKLISCGFAPVTLGPRVLHVEAAVPALLSRLF